MADQADIRKWKDEYGRVFSVHLNGIDYIFHALTHAEYERFEKKLQDEGVPEAEDCVLSLGLLDPLDVEFDKQPAGVVSTLAEEIIDVSGFNNPKTAKDILEEKREEVEEVWGLMKSFVIATMPAYREEELDDLTFADMAYKVALAEAIIRVNQAVFGIENSVTLDLIDPQEEQSQMQEQAMKHNVQKKPGQASHQDPIAQKLRNSLGG